MFSIAIAEAVCLGSGKGFANLRPHSYILFFEDLPEDIAVRSNGELKDNKPDRKAKKSADAGSCGGAPSCSPSGNALISDKSIGATACSG
jgi:hypothetical protein